MNLASDLFLCISMSFSFIPLSISLLSSHPRKTQLFVRDHHFLLQSTQLHSLASLLFQKLHSTYSSFDLKVDNEWGNEWVTHTREATEYYAFPKQLRHVIHLSSGKSRCEWTSLLWLHLLWSRDGDDQKDIKRWRWDTFRVIIFPGFDTKKMIQRNREVKPENLLLN